MSRDRACPVYAIGKYEVGTAILSGCPEVKIE